MGLPGVKVGPLDPDTTSDFGQVAQRNSARRLIRLHAQAHPAELTRQLSRPLDPERTKGLDLDEVRSYLDGQELENGDPLVPDGARVVGASVRGDRDTEQVLTFTYLTPSGRTAKWHAAYDADGLPDSVEAGDELVKVREMKDRGVVAFDSEGTHTELLRREAGRLRRENEALRAQAEARGDGELPPETPGDTRADVSVVEEAEQLRRTNQELVERNAQLESALDSAATQQLRSQAPAPDSPLADDEPIAEYDKLNADAVVKHLRDEGTSDEDRQRILDYERAHADRKTVVGAAEVSLGTRGDS